MISKESGHTSENGEFVTLDIDLEEQIGAGPRLHQDIESACRHLDGPIGLVLGND